MQKGVVGGSSGMTTGQNAAPFFSTLFTTSFSSGSSNSNSSSSNIAGTAASTPARAATASRSRPNTSAGEKKSSSSSSSSQPPPSLPQIPPLTAATAATITRTATTNTTEHRHRRNVLTKERRLSLNKKSSFSRRRASSSSGAVAVGFLFHQGKNSSGSNSSNTNKNNNDDLLVDRDASPPPPVPLSAATIKPPSVLSASPLPRETQPQQPQQPPGKMLSSSFGGSNNVTTGLGISSLPASAMASTNGQLALPTAFSQPSEATLVHQHIQEMAAKRISTLEYLRKAHEGRVYWFNTLRFDRPDFNRMPYFEARRLARRATNYLLLGLSLPAVVDLNSSSALELLRSLGALLVEFETYQQLHSETGSSSAASSLSRAARLPQMFRRSAPSSKARRTSSSAASGSGDMGSLGGGSGGMGGSGSGGASGGYVVGSPDGSFMGLDSIGASTLTLVASEGGALSGGGGGSAGGGGVGAAGGGGNNSSSNGILTAAASAASASASASAASTAFVTHYDNNADLLPGEEYTFLLTPSLPFDPDFFETFVTLCDVLIDCYARLLSLLPTPRECSGHVADQFAKTDARIRKLLVQGVVKEFEEHSRAGVKTEVANVGKVVLGGLM